MKKFKFKLQAVLDYRTKQLDEVQQDFAKEEHKRQEMLARIAECDQLIETMLREQQERMENGPLDIVQAQQFPQFLLKVKQQRFEEFHKLQIQEEIVLIKRNELKDAVVKKKSLELLKDKAQKAFNTKILMQEEEMLSEIALNKAARRIQQAQKTSRAS